jgi:hypothetical protein
LEKTRTAKQKNLKTNKIKTFFRLISLDIPPDPDLLIINAEWNRSYYPPKIRDFIFKFNSNILGLNTRVSHFNANVDRACTFCKIAQKNLIGPIMEETFEHLFFSCPHTNKVLNTFFAEFLHDLNLNLDTEKKSFLFTGINPITNSNENCFLSSIAKLICYYIWDCKLKKTVPSVQSLTNDVFYNLENMRKANSAISNAMTLNLLLCRNWAEATSHRR